MPANIHFTGTGEMTILEAALESDVALDYSCDDGTCGTCKVRLLAGSIEQEDDLEGLTRDDYENGYILCCSATPRSDLTIEARYHPELKGIKKVTLPCKVDKIEYPAPDVAVLSLRVSPDSNLKYLPGQFFDIVYKDVRRSYSISNPASGNETMELHIRNYPNGVFSQYVFGDVKKGDLLRIVGPYGTFIVHESKSPVIFIAGGTGYAPVHAMIEAMLQKNTDRKIYFYWGSQTVDGFYDKSPQYWCEQNPNIKYTPVLSSDFPDWEGRRGFVHQAVLDDFDDLSGYDIYACGSQAMIEASRQAFLQKGMDMARFFADAFTPSR